MDCKFQIEFRDWIHVSTKRARCRATCHETLPPPSFPGAAVLLHTGPNSEHAAKTNQKPCNILEVQEHVYAAFSRPSP